MTISATIFEAFKGQGTFTLQDAYKKAPHSSKTTLRARIYEKLGIQFERVAKGVYQTIDSTTGESVVLLEQDGRDLSMLKDNSIDAIITDHPWSDKKANKGGNRSFADYDCFRYEQNDFDEKARVLKDGSFLVEILPSETETNFEYLYEIKKMAQESGLNYYAKVAWKKGSFVSNTGRKSKNTQDVMIFTKGKARALRLDAKKTKATGQECYMSGANGMLPAMFDVQPVGKKEKIHQSEMPTPLLEQIIDYITLPNEVILDQFSGSGVVGEACLNTGRSAILIELLHENIEKIRNRFANNPDFIELT